MTKNPAAFNQKWIYLQSYKFFHSRILSLENITDIIVRRNRSRTIYELTYAICHFNPPHCIGLLAQRVTFCPTWLPPAQVTYIASVSHPVLDRRVHSCVQRFPYKHHDFGIYTPILPALDWGRRIAVRLRPIWVIQWVQVRPIARPCQREKTLIKSTRISIRQGWTLTRLQIWYRNIGGYKNRKINLNHIMIK